MTIKSETMIMDATDISRTLKRIAFEIIDKNHGADNLVLVGIQTRGVFIAKRLSSIIESIEKKAIPVGILDITMYRDDFRIKFKQPKAQVTSIPFDVEGKTLVVVDDVFFTGRTIRSALDAIMDFGRPAYVRLAVLIDRGHRELPLKADFTGKKIQTGHDEEIRVRMIEEDGKDEVTLVRIETEEKN